VPEVVSEGPSIVAIIRELKPSRMSQHVGMDREGKLCGFAGALNHAQEPRRSHWRACFGREDVRTTALQWA
jgi:hypothetical protein